MLFQCDFSFPTSSHVMERLNVIVRGMSDGDVLP
jgi:hypothetical protein